MIDPEILLQAYSIGIFPMSDARDDPDVFWVEPKKRAILPLDGLNISRSLAKTLRQDKFTVTTDTAFAQVIRECAASMPGREDTWINADIEAAFHTLHRQGRAHSVECWADDNGVPVLVGGLYGLSIGRVFCGESMFSRKTDASKIALLWLVARLRCGGFELLDCQFMTDHLASLGAIEISQQRYVGLLSDALYVSPEQNATEQNAADQNGHSSIVVSSVTGSSSAASGSGSASRSAREGDWLALDGFLAAALGAAPAASGSPSDLSAEASFSVSSSPGKLILHSLTQMS
jgi:leucyl/phenylalanyl-tRNA---protein transferase